MSGNCEAADPITDLHIERRPLLAANPQEDLPRLHQQQPQVRSLPDNLTIAYMLHDQLVNLGSTAGFRAEALQLSCGRSRIKFAVSLIIDMACTIGRWQLACQMSAACRSAFDVSVRMSKRLVDTVKAQLAQSPDQDVDIDRAAQVRPSLPKSMPPY